MVCLARAPGLVGLPGQVAGMAPWGCPCQGQDMLLSPDCARGKQLRKHICWPSGEESSAQGCVDAVLCWARRFCAMGGWSVPSRGSSSIPGLRRPNSLPPVVMTTTDIPRHRGRSPRGQNRPNRDTLGQVRGRVLYKWI